MKYFCHYFSSTHLDFISKILQTHFETELSKTQKCVQGWENAQTVKQETEDKDNEAPSDKTCYQTNPLINTKTLIGTEERGAFTDLCKKLHESSVVLHGRSRSRTEASL